MYSKIFPFLLLIILSLILAACQAPPASPESIVEMLVVTEVVEATPVETIHVVTTTPEHDGSRTLVLCLSALPETLRPIGNDDFRAIQIFEAIHDGPFDANSFAYQPVLLEKLPSLADGDASLSVVTVSEGDRVVDALGEIVTLDPSADPSILLVPAGGGEPISYQGGEIELGRVSAIFKLLPDLLWSDGVPLTVHDSVYRFNLQDDPDYPFPDPAIERTATYEAHDDLTIEWTGLPGFLDPTYYTNFFDPAPEHLWGELPIDELYESEMFNQKPIGWGPYLIDEFIPGETVTLRKNPNYFRAAEGLPKFETLVMRAVGENTNANIAALLSGECDILDTPLSDQIDLLLELQTDAQVRVPFTTINVWELIEFGIQTREYDDGYQVGRDRPDFFSDVRIRQAFAHCVDRQALVDDIFFGQSSILDTYVPPQHPLFNPEVRHYDFDVQAGSALLEEVGWVDDDGDQGTPRIAQGVFNVPDGTPFEVTYETTNAPLRQQVTPMIKESLAQCGIKVNLQHFDSAEFFAFPPEGRLNGRKTDLSEYAWGYEDGICSFWLSHETPGPAGETWVSIQDGVERAFDSSTFYGWTGFNRGGFVNGDFDLACGTTLRTLPGQIEYETAYLEAQRIFAEQLPVVPLYLYIKQSATRPDLCGFINDPTGNSFWNIEEFDYGEGCEE
jgi:peptide/nickel transport system substrate-binding protein